MSWFTIRAPKMIPKAHSILQGGLQDLLKAIKEQDADKVSVGLASTLDTAAELELLQVTINYR